MSSTDLPAVGAIPGGVRLRLRVQPRARRSGIEGVRAGRIRVALQAPPVEGKANDACIRFLARELGVRRSQITLVAGEKAREKTVDVEGLTVIEASQALGLVEGGEEDRV